MHMCVQIYSLLIFYSLGSSNSSYGIIAYVHIMIILLSKQIPKNNPEIYLTQQKGNSGAKRNMWGHASDRLASGSLENTGSSHFTFHFAWEHLGESFLRRGPGKSLQERWYSGDGELLKQAKEKIMDCAKMYLKFVYKNISHNI